VNANAIQMLGLRIAAWVALLYAAILVLTAGFDSVTASRHKTVSFYRDYPNSIYANTAAYAVYGMDQLDNYPRQVFILGASVSARAFDPEQLMKGLPGYKVHNLSVSASNVSQMTEVIDLLSARVDWRHLDSAIFVFGDHFVSFLENDRKFGGLTKIEVEELRHHLYKNDGGVIKPELSPRAMATALFLIKPFAFVYKIKYEADEAVSELKDAVAYEAKTAIHGRPAQATLTDQPDEMAAMTNPPDEASYYRALRTKQFRNAGLTDEQFDLFMKLVTRLDAGAAKVVFVDMPVPSYFRKGFSVYDDYRRREVGIIHDPRVHYLDLTAIAPDGEFLDDAHPRPEFSGKWTTPLLIFLKSQSAPNRDAPSQRASTRYPSRTGTEG
jgi:hypothetical protein